MRPIVAGILGSGRIGKLHANNLVAIPGVSLKSIVDPYAGTPFLNALASQPPTNEPLHHHRPIPN